MTGFWQFKLGAIIFSCDQHKVDNMTYSQIVLISVLISLMTLGYFSLLRKRKNLIAKHTFTTEYLNKFGEFSNQILNQEKLSDQLYIWLTKNVDKMQEMLGLAGMVQYRPPFAKYIITNYQILINTLAQVPNGMAEEDDIRFCLNLMLRFVGVLEGSEKDINKNLRNPLVWFLEGVRLVITSPLYLLYSFGLLGSSTVERISESPFARFISGIIALIGFLASLVQILQGWDDVVKLLRTF
jgi:hypothetical protein